MAIAARSPAAPPPTIRMSCAAPGTPSLTSPLLVRQDLPVVMDDEAVTAAVVELLPAGAAAAGVAQVLGDQTLVVLGHVLLAPVRMSARSEPWPEGSRDGAHGPSPVAGEAEPRPATLSVLRTVRRGKGTRPPGALRRSRAARVRQDPPDVQPDAPAPRVRHRGRVGHPGRLGAGH